MQVSAADGLNATCISTKLLIMKNGNSLWVSSIGARLRLARLDQKLSLSAAARRVGRSRQSVAGWEAGTALIGVAQLALLANLYGVTADYLIFGDNLDREGLQGAADAAAKARDALQKAMRPD